MKPRHFLTLLDLSGTELRGLIDRAIDLKKSPHVGYRPLQDKVLAMIFEKSSTRTRLSFEVGMVQLGGSAIFLSPRDTQLGRGEPIADSARVISRMVDCAMLRTHTHESIKEFAEHSKVPVINGLTDLYHPCQLLADILTFFEYRGEITGKTVAWIGDGNNMCHSYINAARQFEFQLRIGCPNEYRPNAEILDAAGKRIELLHDPLSAVKGADLVVTDVWASMGQEQEQQDRIAKFQAYQVNRAMLERAAPEALFMHCLPAHRGEEVNAEIIDGPQSVVWDEAENRLHAQKALLELLLVE